jgi:hypothetical protein
MTKPSSAKAAIEKIGGWIKENHSRVQFRAFRIQEMSSLTIGQGTQRDRVLSQQEGWPMPRFHHDGADPMQDAETVADALREWSGGEIKVRLKSIAPLLRANTCRLECITLGSTTMTRNGST